MQPFAFLTTQGRARRLRALAVKALKQYDFEVARLRLVNNETNCTFRIDTTDGEIYALRISLPDVHSLEQIEAEVAFQLAISRETDIPVAVPISTRAGEYVVTAAARGVPEERHCVLFSWLRGRMLEEVASPASIHKLGAVVAQLHAYGATQRPESWGALRRMNTLYPLGDREMLLDPSTKELFSPSEYCLLQEMRAASKRELEWLHDGGRAPQIIHGDLHWWNVLSYRGKLQIIDFEDVCWAFPVQDIAISLYYMAGRANFDVLRDALRTGYETILPWPELYPGQIELHMVHRAVDLFNFVLGSTLRHDQDLLDHFIKSIQTHHRKVFETWRSQFDEANYQ